MTVQDSGAIRFVSGSPSDEELAAVTAVLSALAVESESLGAQATAVRAPTAWSRSQRSMRSAWQPGPGRWQHFGR
ncbi:acyl-CoA carboxylase subunit epsilon [Mycetocola reblochoni]|uniref:Acyl-CoA carboxylase epsilon subunit n=2 Tax=Mycetocola reblochoni TaxID=331618 RepID=A0A1R4K019_9MICO|nr:acyl-CoA carboxylase subunit epsilon [Mycetocola reblochoni]RLP70489.1 acyl-CoA carboxylase subunit epsilon [Mycetocola reblochoni]SJN37690.1 hypothetical protein FM119_10550 [Mycetocola reblochoni REB411]